MHYRKTRLALFVLIQIVFVLTSRGQHSIKTPLNRVGGFIGVEGNTSSGVAGIDYERVLYSSGPLQLGAKGIYIFRYQVENLAWFSGGANDYKTVGMVLGTARFYTNTHKRPSGFFLHTGIGYGMAKHTYYDKSRNQSHAAADFGLGWTIPFDAYTGMQIGSSLLFGSEGGTVRLGVAFNF